MRQSKEEKAAKHRSSCAAWRKANPEKCKAHLTKWRLANPEKFKEHSRAHRKKNREKYNEISKLYSRAARAKNPEKVRLRNLKYYLSRYGLSIAEFEQMLTSQNGVCAICRHPEKRRYRLSVDHDHESGRVRGLLCSQCNFAIGLMSDEPGRLIAAAQYLTASLERYAK